MTERTITINGYTFILNDTSNDLSMQIKPPENKDAETIKIKSINTSNLKEITSEIKTETSTDGFVANATALKNYFNKE